MNSLMAPMVVEAKGIGPRWISKVPCSMILVAVALIGSMISLIPLMFEYNVSPNHLGVYVILSSQFFVSLHVLVAACTTMLFDMVIDLAFSKTKKVLFARGVIVFTLLGFAVAMISLIANATQETINEHFVLRSFIIGVSSSLVLVINSLLYMMHTLDVPIFSPFSVLSCSVSITIYCMFHAFSGIQMSSSVDFSDAAFIIAAIVIGCNLLRWVKKLFDRWVVEDLWTDRDTYAASLMLPLSSAYIGSLYMFRRSQLVPLSADLYALPGLMYALSVAVILVNIIVVRLGGWKAVHEKDELIEAKKAYVRYLSHEIRTPLNRFVHIVLAFCNLCCAKGLCVSYYGGVRGKCLIPALLISRPSPMRGKCLIPALLISRPSPAYRFTSFSCVSSSSPQRLFGPQPRHEHSRRPRAVPAADRHPQRLRRCPEHRQPVLRFR